MKLSEYLKAHKQTDEAFGLKLGMSRSQVNRLRRGVSMPSWETAAKIAEVTKGKVRITDWPSQEEMAEAS